MEKKLRREETEIRDQVHLMDAEGTSNFEPTKQEVKDHLIENGWVATDIDIWFDTMQKFWRWNCTISRPDVINTPKNNPL